MMDWKTTVPCAFYAALNRVTGCLRLGLQFLGRWQNFKTSQGKLDKPNYEALSMETNPKPWMPGKVSDFHLLTNDKTWGQAKWERDWNNESSASERLSESEMVGMEIESWESRLRGKEIKTNLSNFNPQNTAWLRTDNQFMHREVCHHE